jgi:hypothetical protein
MSEDRPRQRYNSVSQREMVKDNRTFLIQAILDPIKTREIYEFYYPEHYQILQHQFEDKKQLRKVLNESTIRQYISRLVRSKGFIRHNTREIFRQHLLSLDLKMSTDRRNVT